MVEFPRYKYQRIQWAKEGITDESSLGFKFAMHKEIFVQAVANMGPLSLPLMVQVYSGYSEPLSLLEIIGWLLWLCSLVFEHSADKQKKKFIKNCAAGQVCDVGLWQYCRHPNYFGEILLWFGLFGSASSVFEGYQYLSVLCPIFVYLLITQLSGVPMLEKAGMKKWGHLAAYKEYIAKTPTLVPFT